MEYARNGNFLIVRLNRGEEILSSVAAVCEKEHVDSASVVGIGAVDFCKVGIYRVETREYRSKELFGEREITSLVGNVSVKDGGRCYHFHIAVGGSDLTVSGGHLIEARISATAELYVTVFPITATRVTDETIGLNILQFPSLTH